MWEVLSLTGLSENVQVVLQIPFGHGFVETIQPSTIVSGLLIRHDVMLTSP